MTEDAHRRRRAPDPAREARDRPVRAPVPRPGARRRVGSPAHRDARPPRPCRQSLVLLKNDDGDAAARSGDAARPRRRCGRRRHRAAERRLDDHGQGSSGRDHAGHDDPRGHPRASSTPPTQVRYDAAGDFAGVDRRGRQPASPTSRSSCSPSSRTPRVPATAPTSRSRRRTSTCSARVRPLRRAARRRAAVGPSARRHRRSSPTGTPSSPPGCPAREGDGVADVLFGQAPFTGRLPYTWPRSNEQLPIDPTAPPGPGCDGPLFPLGFGLTTDQPPPAPFCASDG